MFSLSLLFSFVIGCAKSPEPEVAAPPSVSPPNEQAEGCASESPSQDLPPLESDTSSCTDVTGEGGIQSGNQPPQEEGGKFFLSSMPEASVTILATETTESITGPSPLSGTLPAGVYEGVFKSNDGEEAAFTLMIKKGAIVYYCWSFQTDSECEL